MSGDSVLKTFSSNLAESCAKKYKKNFFGDPSKIFTQKSAIDETVLRKSFNLWKTIDGNNASQTYPYPMTIRLWRSHHVIAKPNSITKVFLKYSVNYTGLYNGLQCYQRQVAEIVSSPGRICSHCTTVFGAICQFCQNCTCQRDNRLLTNEVKKGKWSRESHRRCL